MKEIEIGMTQPAFLETVDVGVDYFTITGTTQSARQKVWNFGMSIVDQERHRGNVRRLWNWKAYQGFHCGSAEVGHRDDSAIVRVAGGLAREHYRKAYEVCTNCSRIDAQVTVRADREPQKLIASEFKRALKWSEGFDRKPAVDMHWSNNGTATAYFNKRVSDRFGRIYDKGAQSSLPVMDGCVRYELEFKNDVALWQLKSLATSDSPHRTIARDLSHFFRFRKCLARWNPAGRQTLVLQMPAADRERQLEWIAKSVRPTVERLIADGELHRVINALGLSEFTFRRLVQLDQTLTHAKLQKEA